MITYGCCYRFQPHGRHIIPGEKFLGEWVTPVEGKNVSKMATKLFPLFLFPGSSQTLAAD